MLATASRAFNVEASRPIVPTLMKWKTELTCLRLHTLCSTFVVFSSSVKSVCVSFIIMLFNEHKKMKNKNISMSVIMFHFFFQVLLSCH